MYVASPLSSFPRLLILPTDYISWKCIWCLRYVRDLLRLMYGLIGSYVCVAHQPLYSLPTMAYNCLY